MPEFSFRIGQVFPADDLLARFVTVVAMISNDWLRLMADMEAVEGLDEKDRQGRELLNYRLQAALHYEAATFLRENSTLTGVAEFIASLPDGAREDLVTVVSGLDDEAGHGSWFGANRNRMFHYSRIRNARQPIAKALRKAASDTGTVTWGRRLELRRCGFADNVALEWMPPAAGYETLLERMSDAVMALARFSDCVVGAYLRQRGVLPD